MPDKKEKTVEDFLPDVQASTKNVLEKNRSQYITDIRKTFFDGHPGLGMAVSAGGGALIGALLNALLGNSKGKGAALGALAGGALSLPFVAASAKKPVRYKHAMWSTFNEAIARQPLENFIANKDSLAIRSRTAIADALGNAARYRFVKDLTSQQPKGYVTTQDVVRGALSAGLGAVSAQVLGQVLGVQSPRSWQSTGAGIGAALSLGNSLGLIR